MNKIEKLKKEQNKLIIKIVTILNEIQEGKIKIKASK